MPETDGIEETLEGTLRVAVTAAARAGELLARQREERLRRAQAVSEQAALELRGRYEAERSVARASLTAVRDPGWWDRASNEDMAAAYETVAAWGSADPEVAAAGKHIAIELQTRHGVSIETHDADVAAAMSWLWDQDQESFRSFERMTMTDNRETRREAENKLVALWKSARGERNGLWDATTTRSQRSADKANAHTAEVAALVEQIRADRLDSKRAEARTTADPRYDSPERRQEMSVGLEPIADTETVDARVRADISQAKPAAEATRPTSTRPRRARQSRATTARQRDRGLRR